MSRSPRTAAVYRLPLIQEHRMKKTAVIFDMDGLMFDTQWIYDKAFDDIALEQYGFEPPW